MQNDCQPSKGEGNIPGNPSPGGHHLGCRAHPLATRLLVFDVGSDNRSTVAKKKRVHHITQGWLMRDSSSLNVCTKVMILEVMICVYPLNFI
jgi:hypothetical protein